MGWEDVGKDLNDAGVRDYLLGLLPEAQAEALEDAYLGRPEVWERVRGLEDDLLDDYVSGRLGREERGAFERRYLASPRLRERVVAARALRLAARAGTRRRSEREVRLRWLVPSAIAAGLLLAVAVLARLPTRPSRATSASPAPPATLPTLPPTPGIVPPAPAAPAASRLVLALSPVLLRGETGPPELRIPGTADTVVFELQGDPALLPGPDSALEVTVETVEGAPVWRGAARRTAGGRAPGRLASAAVPAALLGTGDYLVTLSAAGADGGPLYRYFVRVVP
jgi:hypothetical protein